ILVKLFISEIVHTEDSFLLKLYYKFNFATEPNILLAIGAFIVFGIVGYFLINDASSMGKYLFVTLIALIIASLIGIFIHNPIFHTVITVISLLLFLLYTLYDFNRMKRGQFSPREMGFNLFINLLNIIEDILRLANRFKN
ncbi:Bax inhibitor-1 family protein, partial [Staphylococcus capitis]